MLATSETYISPAPVVMYIPLVSRMLQENGVPLPLLVKSLGWVEERNPALRYNQVKHGYLDDPRDWPFSSLTRLIARGIYEDGWAAPLDVAGLDCD